MLISDLEEKKKVKPAPTAGRRRSLSKSGFKEESFCDQSSEISFD